MSEEQAFCEDFESSLSDLTLNSKPLINMLTMLSEENIAYAPHVVRLIEERLNQAKSAEKLPVLYLLDSILKNVNGTYRSLFTKNIVSVFCGVFAKVDEKTRQAMFKLRTTWNEFFPPNKLHPLDVQVNSIDPAWPIMTPPPQQPTIHVNPKFIKKTDSGGEILTPTDDASGAPLNEELQRQADQEKQEALMRQQLIAKQHELLQLQQKKLEMELQQTKSRIEQQTKDLEQKKVELVIQAQRKQQLEQPKVQSQTQAHLQSKPVQHLQPKAQQKKALRGDIAASKPQPVATNTSTRDPRINSRDPRIRDPRLAQQKTNTQPKVTAPAVQEIIKELANSPRLSPLADSPQGSPVREIPQKSEPADTKKMDTFHKKRKANKESPKGSKEIPVKQTRNYRKADKDKPNQSSRADSKAKTNNKSVDSKTDIKENKPDSKEVKKDDNKEEKPEETKTGKEKKTPPSRVGRDRKSVRKTDSGKSSDKNDKREKAKDKKGETKSESDRSSGSRRSSVDDKNRSRSKSPGRSRSKSPTRTGARSPRSRGLSPKTESRRYMTRSRSPLRRNRRDVKDRVERRGRDARPSDKNRKENDEREDGKMMGGEGIRGRDSYSDDRYPRRRPGDYAGPDFPPMKRARMGRAQDVWADDWRRQGWSGNRQWSRPPGRRPLERRLSLDPDVKIPKELTLSKQKDIIEQAGEKLNSGQLSHKEHQELLMQLNDLYQLQRLREEKMTTGTPVVYSRPARDYDARRDTDDPQTYFKGMESAPSSQEGQPITAKDVDERVLELLMPSVGKADPRGQSEEVFGGSLKGDVDMRELPMSESQNQLGSEQSENAVSAQDRSYPPPLMSLPVRGPAGGKEEDVAGTRRFADDADRNSPLPGDNSMFGTTDRDMRRPDESLSFGPGMKDKDMRQLPEEGAGLARDHRRRDGLDQVEHRRSAREEQRSMMKGPAGRNERMDRSRQMAEGPGPMMGEGRMHGMEGPGPMMDMPRPMMPGPMPGMDGPPLIRPMMDGGIRPEGVQMQGMNAGAQMMPQNMLSQLMMRGAGMPGPMANQSMAGPQFSLGGPMMTQPPAFGMMGPGQQMPGMPSMPAALANMGMQQQGFPMVSQGMGMMNFGMGGPMVPQGIPQHVMQSQAVGTGTPPQQDAATTQVDVNSLFSKLLQAGIIHKGGSNSPRPGADTPPPQSSGQDDSKKAEKEEDGEEEQQDLLIPEIGFYPEELRVRFQGVINRIYNGIQCSSCGLRFLPEEMDRYAKHLDWHFRLNRREKDGAKRATSRKWYYKVDDWIKFEEIDDIEEGARSEFFELQARLGLSDLIKKPNQVTSIAVTGEDDSEEVCDICQESFEQFWDEEEEQWQLKDAIRVDGKTYHPLCYEDTKDVTVVPETPTPVEEPAKPQFPVVTETAVVTTTETAEATTTETAVVTTTETAVVTTTETADATTTETAKATTTETAVVTTTETAEGTTTEATTTESAEGTTESKTSETSEADKAADPSQQESAETTAEKEPEPAKEGDVKTESIKTEEM